MSWPRPREPRTLASPPTLNAGCGSTPKKTSLKAHTRKYNEVLLVHIEEYPDPWSAIAREKELKDWNRAKKVELIETGNPNWLDLSAEW